MKKIVDITVALLALLFLLYFSYLSFSSAKELEHINKEYYESQTDIGELLQRRFDSLVSTLTLGAVKEKNQKAQTIEELKAQSILIEEKNKKVTIALGIVAALIVLGFFLLDRYIYALLMALSSLVTLLFGLFTPILMIVIHKSVNYLGDIVLTFESKTIIGTIAHLYKDGNYPVAIAILLFSAIVPLLKTLSMIAVLLWKRFHMATRIVTFFKHLGKWSMLDVFVVSLLLVYLSAGSSENSYSQIESGLYIFLVYVIFSIITSIVVERVIIKKGENVSV